MNGGGVLQAVARSILATGTAEGILGYAAGLAGDDIGPVFITKPEDATALLMPEGAPYGLLRLARDYLSDRRIAVFARTCDIRAFIELVKRKCFAPEQVFTVGINCDAAPGPGARSSCRRCEYPRATMADLEISIGDSACAVTAHSARGEDVVKAAELGTADPFTLPDSWCDTAVATQESDLTSDGDLEQRLEYWMGQFDKCIKCYGCRNACPLCYCKDCYLNGGRGLVPGGQLAPPRIFHLTRLAHVADSCLNCGQCEAACPMGIPLTRLYHKLHRELAEIFDYRPGLDSSPPPLMMFNEAEKSDGRTVFEGRR